MVMGHYVRGTRRVIPVVTCPVQDQRGNELAFRFRDELTRAGAPTGNAPAVKSLAVRVGAATAEIMATLVVTGEPDRQIRTASRRVVDADGPSSFHVNLHPRGDAYIFGPHTRHVSGSERMREEIGGISFLISPTAFFQTNVHAAEILVREVVAAVPSSSHVLDLYAGAGLFALPLAHAGHRVTAIEESHAAVADGKASRRLNRIVDGQCRFIARRVEDALTTVRRRRYDAVVLDPPRAGCSPRVLQEVFAGIRPPRVIYVSCNPEALARDLQFIVRLGYRVESLQPVDMFPHTAHVETVTVLIRSAKAPT